MPIALRKSGTSFLYTLQTMCRSTAWQPSGQGPIVLFVRFFVCVRVCGQDAVTVGLPLTFGAVVR